MAHSAKTHSQRGLRTTEIIFQASREIAFSAGHIMVTKKASVRMTGKKISRLCNGSGYFTCQSNCFSFPKATTEYNGLPKQEDIMHKRRGRTGAM